MRSWKKESGGGVSDAKAGKVMGGSFAGFKGKARHPPVTARKNFGLPCPNPTLRSNPAPSTRGLQLLRDRAREFIARNGLPQHGADRRFLEQALSRRFHVAGNHHDRELGPNF